MYAQNPATSLSVAIWLKTVLCPRRLSFSSTEFFPSTLLVSSSKTASLSQCSPSLASFLPCDLGQATSR